MNPYMPSAGSHSVAVERYRHRWRAQLTCGAPAKRVCAVRTWGTAKGKFGRDQQGDRLDAAQPQTALGARAGWRSPR